MSQPQSPHTPAHSHLDVPDHPADTMEELVGVIPLVLPVVGGVLMFMLAFIAIYMA
ncbi:MAG: hypothetical protein ACKVOO_12255 [Burkholderiaceae bacterium]